MRRQFAAAHGSGAAMDMPMNMFPRPFMHMITAAPPRYLLEAEKPFPESLLWALQERYFTEKGSDAWRYTEVPHYVTNNPSLANTYAEIVFASWRDQARLLDDAALKEPLHIVELGAGSGRLAYHFLQRLCALCAQFDVPCTSFKYILTDYAAVNLAFWRQHARLQPYFENGMLDLGLFDARNSAELCLQISGLVLGPGSLQRPLIAIANYLFDSIPQELILFEDGKAHRCRVALEVDADPVSLKVTQLLERLRCIYSYSELDGPLFAEENWQALLDSYRANIERSHVLFPVAGLGCLERLKSFSTQGLLLLSTDKGEHQLASLQNLPPPEPDRHGSFSLQVNYHALGMWCEQAGGMKMFPESLTLSINVCALLVVADPARWTETRMAYRRQVIDFSPDDFYTISFHARQAIAIMSIGELLAHLRLAYHDPHACGHYLLRLGELAPGLTVTERVAATAALEKVWQIYYPLGEELNLAEHMAYFFCMLEDFPRALLFYQRATELYPERSDSGTLYNRAWCHTMQGDFATASGLLRTLLEASPEHSEALALLKDCSERLNPISSLPT
jgi:tetratricopeptide (TPR) repeat protein